jgi:hypothetical protein
MDDMTKEYNEWKNKKMECFKMDCPHRFFLEKIDRNRGLKEEIKTLWRSILSLLIVCFLLLIVSINFAFSMNNHDDEEREEIVVNSYGFPLEKGNPNDAIQKYRDMLTKEEDIPESYPNPPEKLPSPPKNYISSNPYRYMNLERLLQLADQEDTGAQFEIGNRYYNGIGVQKNAQIAQEYFKKSWGEK